MQRNQLMAMTLALAALVMIVGYFMQSKPKVEERLPYLGEPKIVDNNGVKDTLNFTIPQFWFHDQDSQMVNNQTFKDKAYVTNFFFTKCPTICPITQRNMLRIYEKYRNDNRLMLLSHSIDTKYDTIPALKNYADKMGIEAPKWHLVTGAKDSLYYFARQYMVTAMDDEKAPGGYAHSGHLVLVDAEGHIRAAADGTDDKAVDKLLGQIDILLKEME
jgi:protein SCO1/2